MNKAKKKRLGRGLDALLGATVEEADANVQGTQLKELPVEHLRRGQYQPRTRMDEESLQELSASIRARGVVQPVVVRPLATGGFEIIAGERRWRAAQLAGLDTIPVIVRNIPDEAALVTALIENIQREDLNPIEEARGIKRLLEEFGLTHEQAAEGVGRSRSAVTNLLRLLSLAPVARQLLEQGAIDMGHARALLSLPGPAQESLAQEIAARGLSVRQAEEAVKRSSKAPDRKPAGSGSGSQDIQRLEQALSERLGSPVTVKDKNGRGRIVIRYHSLDELDGILERIG